MKNLKLVELFQIENIYDNHHQKYVQWILLILKYINKTRENSVISLLLTTYLDL